MLINSTQTYTYVTKSTIHPTAPLHTYILQHTDSLLTALSGAALVVLGADMLLSILGPFVFV
jgi:hypothetical protein